MTHQVYRPDIDGLRAIAVLAVVIYHATPGLLPGGFIGVDIFFAISGYLITGLILEDLRAGRFSLSRFYERRIRRLFPAALLVLGFTVVAGWLVLYPGELQILGRHILASGFFLQNFQLWSETGYFDVAAETKPLLHLWSLAIEEQFYLFWPVLLAFVWRFARGWLPVLAALGIASFALNVHQTGEDPAAAYFSPFGRFWELMAGAGLAYIAHRKGSLVPAAAAAPLGMAGIGLICFGLATITPDDPFPGWRALMPVAGCIALIAAGPTALPNARLLSLHPMVYLGLISYPLYMWHWPLLSFVRIVHPDLSPMAAIGIVIIAAGLAVLTYHLVERPIRRHGAAALGTIGLLTTMAIVLVAALGIQRGHVDARLQAVTLREGDEWRFLMTQVDAFDPQGFGTYPLSADRDRLSVFVGDSQIAQYAERLASTQSRNAAANGAMLFLGGACPPIPGVMNDEIERRPCWPLRDEAYRFASDPRVETVVIGASWSYYLLWSDAYIVTDGQKERLDTPRGRALALSALEAQIERLRDDGLTVYLLLGNPGIEGLRPTQPEDRARFDGRPRDPEERVPVTDEQIAVHEDLLSLARRSGAIPIDPWEAFCTGRTCRWAAPDGTPIYSDSSHFNPAWALDHAGFIDRTLLP